MSPTLREIGDTTPGKFNLEPLTPKELILELVGLKAQTPQLEAAYLASPNWSTPSPNPEEKVATRPASPPQAPPIPKLLF